MSPPGDNLLRMRLPVPASGATAHVDIGRVQIVLERNRAGVALLAHDGQQGQRHYLGLPREGSLGVAVRAPEFRIRIRIQDSLTLAPDGRLRGYVSVPLPLKLFWEQPGGRTESLLEVMPRELRTAWMGEGPNGGYMHEVTSRFYPDLRGLTVRGGSLVPIVLHNRSGRPLSPLEVIVSLRDRDLHECRGRIVAAPRRLVFNGSETPRESVREFRGGRR
jgi:hypothetical protein